jgi:[acyl-carrier-protein] S-malonyltransferase
MGKVAFVFPGQGSQYTGMGKEVFDSFACSRDVFAAADNALGFSLSDLCFNGPEEALKLTENTQPAILTVSVAVLRILEERRIRPDFVAGHSLGEYSALVCSGAISLRDAVRIVRLRGRYMQEAVPAGMGAMAAVIGLDAAVVSEVCRDSSIHGIVSPANFNSPDQTVIAGETRAVQSASAKLKEKGAKRVISLPVSAPFHCQLMSPARDRLKADLEALSFQNPGVPLISNVDASEVTSGESARDGLVRQVCSPVRWVESIQHLSACGVDRFIEIGPGKVLAGLVKKIAPQAQVLSVENIRGIEALASVLPGATM